MNQVGLNLFLKTPLPLHYTFVGDTVRQQLPGAILAGGCLRDWVLGIKPKDLDFFIGPEHDLFYHAAWAESGWTMNIHPSFDPDQSLPDEEISSKTHYEAHMGHKLVAIAQPLIRGHFVSIQYVEIIQLAKMESPSNLINAFDLGINMIAQDPVTKGLVFNSMWWADMLNQTITINPYRSSLSPEARDVLVDRAEKLQRKIRANDLGVWPIKEVEAE